MKKIFKFFVMVFALTSGNLFSQQFASTGIEVNFGINSINPVATLNNVTAYMESDDFNSLGISAGLYQVNTNGSDSTTHSIAFYYSDTEELQKAYDVSLTSQAVATLLMNSAKNGTTNTNESTYINTREKITPEDVAKNTTFYIWRIKTADVPRYLKDWDKLISEIENNGTAADSYGLKVTFAGGIKNEDLFVWAGYESQKQMMDQLAIFNASQSSIDFNRKISSYTETVSTEIWSQINLWNGEAYTE